MQLNYIESELKNYYWHLSEWQRYGEQIRDLEVRYREELEHPSCSSSVIRMPEGSGSGSPWQIEWSGKLHELRKKQKVEEMYKEYQSNAVFLTDAQKQQKEEEILAQDKATQDLRRKYFGPEGELYKKRESLMKPIQDDIYEAVKSISEGKGYQMVIDRASSANIIFASPRIDISNEVLTKLGYSK